MPPIVQIDTRQMSRNAQAHTHQFRLKTNSRQPPPHGTQPADRNRRPPSGSTGTFAHGCSTPHVCTAHARHLSNILSFLSVVFTPRQKTSRQRRMAQTFQPDVQPADEHSSMTLRIRQVQPHQSAAAHAGRRTPFGLPATRSTSSGSATFDLSNEAVRRHSGSGCRFISRPLPPNFTGHETN